MAKLSTAARKHLSEKSFAIPSKAPGSGSYPIPDRSHAQNALARVSQHGSSAEKAKVRAAVHRKYPSMGDAHGHGSGPIPPQHPGVSRVPDGPNIGDEHHAHHPNMHPGHPDHKYLNRHNNERGPSYAPDYEDTAHVKD